MPYWLYDQIAAERPGWEPAFAMQASLNWIKALNYEINQEHGTTPLRQYESCIDSFTGVRRIATAHIPNVFGSLFHSLTFSMTLVRLADTNICGAFMYPSAIVSWYYAIYNSFRSISSCNNLIRENHSALIAALNGGDISRVIPHPLNIYAIRTGGEKYESILPDYPNTITFNLNETFVENRSTARGMLISYLNGTTQFEADKVKASLRQKHKLNNFRTKAARNLRDQHLQDRINFLNCAFRYRGKANYRDSIFFGYGNDDPRLNNGFIDNLSNTSRFCTISAMAYVKKRIGRDIFSSFITDINRHFRDQGLFRDEQLFWINL